MFILLVAATVVQAFSEGGHHRGDQGEEEADARRAGAVRAAAVARLFEVVRDREPA